MYDIKTEDQCFRESAEELLKFIQKSPSTFHVVKNISEILKMHGFEYLAESSSWTVRQGGKYFVTRNSSSLIAFQVPEQPFTGFQTICSHTDSPTFKIKEVPELAAEGNYIRLNVEKYGGMLIAPWFDRPLSVAGRILVREEKGIRQILVNVDRDLLMIPNLAIHMNREVNDGYHYRVQTDLCPLYADASGKDSFLTLIAETAGVERTSILGTDLYLYNRQPGTFFGAHNEFIASPRLDDLQCVYATLQGFLRAENDRSIPVFCAFDNEETGSLTRQGASATFLLDTLTRVNAALGRDMSDYRQALAQSFMISADNAHAVHPNHPEKADRTNRPQMNEGVVLKFNANQKYTTDARSAAVFKLLCERAQVPYQVFANHSDIPGGSTLGNLANQQVAMYTVDIGLAQLAMHSPCETAGMKDTLYLQRAAEEFYRSSLQVDEEETVWL